MRKPKPSSGGSETAAHRQRTRKPPDPAPVAVAPKASRFARSELLICATLIALCLFVYWPVYRFDFVHYDDGEYVSENFHVQAGLTRQNIAWAFRAFFFDNWHPLTWLSYMLDYQLFGLKPGAFHMANVFFHILNSVLVFIVLKKMTGARWSSAFTAALFAIHPLRVESVAWISERKDVLSGFFFLLTLWAYARYVETSKRSRYFAALIFFALGLMSKPMLVTLPFLLLLLDFWPLRRFNSSPNRSATAAGRSLSISALVVEKVPFIALTILSCIITYRAQTEALVPSSYRPLAGRMANALVSCARYLARTLWPANLGVYYPYPAHWPAWAVAAAALVLLAITVLALALRHQRPYLLVGWFWFLGTLVPVIGLVQVGGQSMADRYMYIPMIGLLIMIAWSVLDATRSSVAGPGLSLSRAIPFLAALPILICLPLSARQVRYWANSITLFEHSLAVTSPSTVIHDNLAAALTSAGRTNEALAHLSAALALDPGDFWAYGNRGSILLGQGKTDEAIATFQQALQLNPTRPELNHNLGVCLVEKKRYDEALPYLSAALRVRPDYANAYLTMGNALVALGKFDEAISNYNEALRLKPGSAAAHYNMGHALNERGRFEEATGHFNQALLLQSTNADAHCNLAVALSRLGKNQDALAHFTEALRLNPTKAEFHFQFASFLFAQKNISEAVAHHREAVRLEPGFVPALNDLAYILAAHEDPTIRNGPEAVQLAERACELTGHQQSFLMATLAAAYAETGQFTKAIDVAQKSVDLAQASGQKDLVASNQKLLDLYRSGRPYRLGN